MIEVEVNGELVALHTGGAPIDTHRAVVLIHGAGMDHAAWRYQTRRLAALGLCPIAPDLPGHGESAGKPLSGIEELGSWLCMLIDRLGIARVDLVGHSMGSLVALEAYRSHPELVDRLVLISTTDRMTVHPRLLDAAQAGDPHAIDLMIGWMHTGGHRLGGHKTAGSWKAGTVRRLLERHLDSALATDLLACDIYDPVPMAPMVGARTLIIQGDADRMTPLSGARRLAALLPDARLAVMPGGGHMVISETSTPAQQILIDFLAADPGATQAERP